MRVERQDWCLWEPLSRLDQAAAVQVSDEVEPMAAMGDQIDKTEVPSHRHASWIHAVLPNRCQGEKREAAAPQSERKICNPWLVRGRESRRLLLLSLRLASSSPPILLLPTNGRRARRGEALYHLLDADGDAAMEIKLSATSAASSLALLRFLPSYQNRAWWIAPLTVTRLDQAVRPPGLF